MAPVRREASVVRLFQDYRGFAIIALAIVPTSCSGGDGTVTPGTGGSQTTSGQGGNVVAPQGGKSGSQGGTSGTGDTGGTTTAGATSAGSAGVAGTLVTAGGSSA